MRQVYWAVLGWVSRRSFYMAVAPWVLPVFGGLLISTHLGNDFSLLWFSVGVILILIGSVPLGIKELYEEHYQRFEDQIDAQERMCLSLLASQLPKIPVSNAAPRDERMRAQAAAVELVVNQLTEQIYANIPDARAVFFRLSEENGGIVFVPIVVSGRSDEPKTHNSDSERYGSMMSLLVGIKETHHENGLENRGYKSYVSASVAQGEDLFGLLTLDTNENTEFGKRDELNLQLLARMIAAFCVAADRGKHIKAAHEPPAEAAKPAEPGL